jgi:hypothetical protein
MKVFLDTLRNHHFSTAQEAVNMTRFPGSITTALRKVRGSELIGSRAAARKTYLTPQHREARVGFALEHLDKDEVFWYKVVFSDEKVFQSRSNGRIRVYRSRNCRYDDNYVEHVHGGDRSGRFSVNMWAWSSATSPVHIIERLTTN